MIGLFYWICGIVTGFFLYSILGYVFPVAKKTDRLATSERYVALDAKELSSPNGVIVKTFPISMKIIIVSQAKFDEITPVPGAQAFAHIDRSPCEIYLPAGYRISTKYSIPDRWEKYPARFLDAKVADVLAHEILHCLHGSWHPPP